MKKLIKRMLRFLWYRRGYREKILNIEFPAFLQFPIFRFVYYRRGIAIYKKLRKQYGGCTICVCPYKGTGDVYLAAAYFKDSEDDKKENLFCVIGNSNKNISFLFGLRATVLSFGQPEIDSLTRFGFFCGLDELNMRILHHAPLNWHGKMTDYLRNINGLNFADLIGYGAFHVENGKSISKPEFPNCDKEVETLFFQHNLVDGKTVLISPYAYTFRYNLPNYMWEKIALCLQNEGYTVCTNICGTEKAIRGTVGIHLEYHQLRSFLERGGFFIGLRSGFCDIVSSIDCKKIIIYQPLLWWNEGTHLEYFSMNRMGLCNDAVELEFRGRIDYLDLLKRVTDAVLQKDRGITEK